MEGCGGFSSRGTYSAAASPDWQPLPVPPSVLRPSLPSPEMLTQMATANLQSPNGPG